MSKLLQQCFLFFIVVVIPGHNPGNSQVSVNRTIGPTLVIIIPPAYKVYRGYIVFAFSVTMFVCLSVKFFSVRDFSETT